MSDRSSNMEIHDVLSSIRRLVSEDKNAPFGRSAKDSKSPAATEEPQDKLVLTPAYRVQNEGGSAAAMTDGEVLPADAASLEDTIAELEAAVAVNGGDFEPDGSEVGKAGRADADPDLERAFEDSFAVDLAAEDEQQSDLSRPVTSGQMDDGDDAGEAAPDAGAEPEGTEEAEDDASEADETPAVATDPENLSPARPGTDSVAVEMPSPEELDALIAAGTAAAAGAAAARRLNLSVGDLVAERGAPWGRIDAPERDEADAAAGDQDSPSMGPAQSALTTLDLQAEADAEILREIVADIVRQELQGPLGERITRSVRMLVRREINRALESRDFE